MTRIGQAAAVVRGVETAVGALVIGYVAFELGRSLVLGIRNQVTRR